jgi:hypothetical protein
MVKVSWETALTVDLTMSRFAHGERGPSRARGALISGPCRCLARVLRKEHTQTAEDDTKSYCYAM